MATQTSLLLTQGPNARCVRAQDAVQDSTTKHTRSTGKQPLRSRTGRLSFNRICARDTQSVQSSHVSPNTPHLLDWLYQSLAQSNLPTRRRQHEVNRLPHSKHASAAACFTATKLQLERTVLLFFYSFARNEHSSISRSMDVYNDACAAKILE